MICNSIAKDLSTSNNKTSDFGPLVVGKANKIDFQTVRQSIAPFCTIELYCNLYFYKYLVLVRVDI